MSLGIEVRPEQYYNAALERLEELRLLRETEYRNTALVAYASGLSVECMLRAFIPSGYQFYPKHDFFYLASQGAVAPIKTLLFGPLNGALNDLAALWRNSLRFYSEDLFETYSRKRLHSRKLTVRREEQASAVLCRLLFDVSEQVVEECQQVWIRLPSPIK